MIGQKLKQLRLQQQKSQQELADFLQTTRATYSNYERCVREPSGETLIKLADYFGVTTDYLLGREPDQQMQNKSKLLQIMDDEKDVLRFLSNNRISFDGTIYDLPQEKTALIKNAVKTAMLLATQEVKQSDEQPTADRKNTQPKEET